MKINRISLCSALLAGLAFGGCGNSENFVFTNSVPIQEMPVTAPPQAVADARAALGNATVNYSAANGVLANDTLNGAEISAFDATASAGGTVDLNADGSFSYTPTFGFVGAETFTYTLSNEDGESTATVTMTSTAQGWFVDNTAGTNGDGSQASPFDTLLEAVAVAEAGDTIYVRRGDGSATGLSNFIDLPQGVSLIGEGQGLVLGQTVEPQGDNPVLGDTVNLNGDNTVSGFTFIGAETGVQSSGEVGTCTVSNNRFEGGSNSDLQIAMLDIVGDVSITGNTFIQDFDADSVSLTTEGTCSVTIDENIFQMAGPAADGDDAITIQVQDGANATIQANGNTFDGSGSTTPSLERGLHLQSNGTSMISLTAANNSSSLVRNRDVELVIDGDTDLTTSLTNNVFENCMNISIGILIRDTSEATAVLEANTITGAPEGLLSFAGGTGTLNIALRNNTRIEGTGAAAAGVSTDDSGNICADITGNTFDGNLQFTHLSDGFCRVEQFGNSMGDVLVTLNTFVTGGINATATMNPIQSLQDNGCMIP